MYTIDVLDSLRDEEQFAELDNLLLPLSAALFPYPILNLESASVFRLRNGDKLPCPNSQEGNVCIMLGEEFIGIANVSAEQQLSAVRFINHTL
jgi:tRNA U55 pseudouridine synthase TruB